MSESKEEKAVYVGSGRGGWGSVLAAPRLVAAPLADPTPLNTAVLRPSQLKPSNNPFTKISLEDNNDHNSSLVNTEAAVEDKKNPLWTPEKTESENKNEESKEIIPKFLPLHSSRDSISFAGGTVPAAPPEGMARACNFVFGQNLQERVVKKTEEGDGSTNNHFEHHATNGTSELLFSAAVKASTDIQPTSSKDESGSSQQSSTSWGRVSEAPLPPVPPPGPIITGEEGESNILQMNCRLFAFEDGQWKERGRGQLRLNDSDSGSRLVCRAAGSLRVLLNTKVWADMTVELAGVKSLRVTATDSQQQVKVFLIMASPDEVGRLSKSLSLRVVKAKMKEESRSESKDDISPTPIIASVVDKDVEQIEKALKDEDISNNSSSDDNLQSSNVPEYTDNKPSINTDRNPVVIISNDDEEVRVAKRHIESEEIDDKAKKICTEDSKGDAPL